MATCFVCRAWNSCQKLRSYAWKPEFEPGSLKRVFYIHIYRLFFGNSYFNARFQGQCESRSKVSCNCTHLNPKDRRRLIQVFTQKNEELSGESQEESSWAFQKVGKIKSCSLSKPTNPQSERFYFRIRIICIIHPMGKLHFFMQHATNKVKAMLQMQTLAAQISSV